MDLLLNCLIKQPIRKDPKICTNFCRMDFMGEVVEIKALKLNFSNFANQGLVFEVLCVLSFFIPVADNISL